MHTTQVQILRCPECDTTLDHTVYHGLFQAGGSSIGPAKRACPECGFQVDTGKSEWRDKSLFQKVGILGGRLIWFCASAFFLGGVAGMIAVWVLDEIELLRPADRKPCFDVVFVIASLLIGLLFCMNVIREIRASERRLAEQGEDS